MLPTDYHSATIGYLLVADYYQIFRVDLDGTNPETIAACCPAPYSTYPYAYGLDFDYRSASNMYT